MEFVLILLTLLMVLFGMLLFGDDGDGVGGECACVTCRGDRDDA